MTSTLREQSDEQIAAGYLTMIANLPREKRLDALADVLATPLEGGVRKPLLRKGHGPMTRIIHPPFDDENLARATRPCPDEPNNMLQLVVTAALIGLAWLVICAFEKGVLV